MNRQAPKYYSQFGEDFLLWEFFDHKSNGFYVDVGAFDGVHLSNTYSFELQGWRGICVEPHPRYYEFCQQSRPNAICVQAATVGSDAQELVEFFTEEMGLLSGIEPGREEDVGNRYLARGLEFRGFSRVNVRAITLNRLLNEYLPANNEIDFLSIDVEGTEVDTLMGLNFERYRPRVIVVETNTVAAKQNITRYLHKNCGYHYARNLAVNAIYSRDASDVARINRIPINCRIEPQEHPLGKEYTIRNFLYGKVISGG